MIDGQFFSRPIFLGSMNPIMAKRNIDIIILTIKPSHLMCFAVKLVGAMAKWLKLQTANAEVPGSSPNHGMEELSRSSFNHCFTPPRCNGYFALGNLSDGAGSSS